MITDEELVTKTLQEGNQHFGELIHRYADYVFGLGMRLAAGRKELAEDISQQAFMKACAGLRSFDKSKVFKHWLTAIAVNCFKDLVARDIPYQPLDENTDTEYSADFDGNSDFFRLIRPLTHEERSIFVLRFVYDYSIEEIGNLMHVKPGTIKSKLSRALEKLR